MGLLSKLSAQLQRHWWRPRPSLLARALQPLAALLQVVARQQERSARRRSVRLPVPVIVVGNLIVGGAGKTPTVLAVLQALQQAGRRPGVISRGYGRTSDALLLVTRATPAQQAGDEPLLIHLRSGAPVAVARDRVEAAQALLAAHPDIDVLVADDGLQHWRLRRDVQVLVFDGRGAGNGLTLPAGPLRQPLPPSLPPDTLLLYNAAEASTALPGALAQRRLAGAVGISSWWAGQAASMPTLHALHGRRIVAAAGLGQPERFFTMLEAEGLKIERLPLPDHASLDPLPWPVDTEDVILTEKDAVKLHPDRLGGTRVWVAALDFALPPAFERALLGRLHAASTPSSTFS